MSETTQETTELPAGSESAAMPCSAAEWYEAQFRLWRMNIEDLIRWSHKMNRNEVVDYLRAMMTRIPSEPNAKSAGTGEAG